MIDFSQIINSIMSFLTPRPRGPMARAHVHVMGRVFEANYPVFAEQAARRRKMKGWMALKNPFSSSALIEFLVEGPDTPVKDFIMDLRKGPPGCYISKVQVEMQQIDRCTLDMFERRS